jgi:hypothetical protein
VAALVVRPAGVRLAERVVELGKMIEKPKHEGDSKATYQPPQVVRVSLRPEEAVLGHCKTATVGGGPFSNSCRSVFCKTLGS